jgi:hypothetical protein
MNSEQKETVRTTLIALVYVVALVGVWIYKIIEVSGL